MNLALFDFDGTITTREMLPDFFRLAVPPLRLAIGKVVLSPLIIGYKLGVVGGPLVRSSIVRFGFGGTPEASYRRFGETFARDALPQVIRPQAEARIDWHMAQGDTVVVVSGAFDVYLSHWCRQRGLALICSSLEARDGTLTGRYAGAQCVGKEKPRRIAERYDLRSYDTIYAYGDTREDFDMLGIAGKKFYRWQEIS
jgi:phosphatidylglycerophosphatase C